MHGLFLEGCGWDDLEKKLIEPSPKVLFTEAPVILLLPTKKNPFRSSRRNYDCPVYITSERKGELSSTGHSTNYLMNIEFESDKEPAHWIKRGAALLTQLDN